MGSAPRGWSDPARAPLHTGHRPAESGAASDPAGASLVAGSRAYRSPRQRGILLYGSPQVQKSDVTPRRPKDGPSWWPKLAAGTPEMIPQGS